MRRRVKGDIGGPRGPSHGKPVHVLPVRTGIRTCSGASRREHRSDGRGGRSPTQLHYTHRANDCKGNGYLPRWKATTEENVMARQDFDKSSKWMLQHHARGILFLGGIREVRQCRALQAEVVQPRRLPDGLLEVHLKGHK